MPSRRAKLLALLAALLAAFVAVLIILYLWYLAPEAQSTSLPGGAPWQELVLFLAAFMLWYAGVTAIYLVGGRSKIIYAWTMGFYGAGIAAYFYLVSRV